MIESSLPPSQRESALLYVNDTRNRVLTSSVKGRRTPYEIYHGRKPISGDFIPFGTIVYVRIKKRTTYQVIL